MTRLRGMTVAAALVAGLMIPAVSLAAPASAEPAGNGPWQTFIEDPFSEIQEDFCDVPGLTVEFEFASVQQEKWSILGPNDFPYGFYFHDGYEKYTNVDTGESVTLVNFGASKDVRKTDNGDGTFTIHVTNKSHGVLYSDEGEVLDRSAGVFSYTVVYNYNGTPSDPTDDFKVGRPTIVRDEGNKADFCAIVVPAIS